MTIFQETDTVSNQTESVGHFEATFEHRESVGSQIRTSTLVVSKNSSGGSPLDVGTNYLITIEEEV